MVHVKTISINNFTTDSGVVYDKIDLHYQHFGQSYQNAPVVLINHSLTGDANVTGPQGWLSEVVGHPIVGRHRVTRQVPNPIDGRG